MLIKSPLSFFHDRFDVPSFLLPNRWLSSIVQSGLQPRLPKMISSSSQHSEPISFLRLPIEVRLQIYELVCAQFDSCEHAYPRGAPASNAGLRPSAALLLVNRQLYTEACLLPFHVNLFTFQRWHGSGARCCSHFLKTIHKWQRSAIRALDLTVTVRDLTAGQVQDDWLEICHLLGDDMNGAERSLQNFTLRIDGKRGCSSKDVMRGDASWAVDGLFGLDGLRRLEIVLDDYEVEQTAIEDFEVTLQGRLPLTRVQVRRADAGI